MLCFVEDGPTRMMTMGGAACCGLMKPKLAKPDHALLDNDAFSNDRIRLVRRGPAFARPDT